MSLVGHPQQPGKLSRNCYASTAAARQKDLRAPSSVLVGRFKISSQYAVVVLAVFRYGQQGQKSRKEQRFLSS